MIGEEDLIDFPWDIIEKVIFCKKDLLVVILFKSGRGLKATQPDEQKWDQFLREATVNLGSDKIFFQE